MTSMNLYFRCETELVTILRQIKKVGKIVKWVETEDHKLVDKYHIEHYGYPRHGCGLHRRCSNGCYPVYRDIHVYAEIVDRKVRRKRK